MTVPNALEGRLRIPLIGAQVPHLQTEPTCGDCITVTGTAETARSSNTSENAFRSYRRVA